MINLTVGVFQLANIANDPYQDFMECHSLYILVVDRRRFNWPIIGILCVRVVQ